MYIKPLRIFALVILALAGCQTPKVLPAKPEIVTIEIHRPVKIDALLLQRCSGKPTNLQQGMTNSDLLFHDLGQANYIACLESRLDGIMRYNDSIK